MSKYLEGLFYWNVKASYNTIVGGVAGSLNSKGYVVISVCGRLYLGHRLAWLYMTGEWPKDEIDHKDTIKNNNKWENLREANRFNNCSNGGKRTLNKSGLKGVSWNKSNSKWVAQIMSNRKKYHLGYFHNKEDAHKAYCEASEKLHQEFSNHG